MIALYFLLISLKIIFSWHFRFLNSSNRCYRCGKWKLHIVLAESTDFDFFIWHAYVMFMYTDGQNWYELYILLSVVSQFTWTLCNFTNFLSWHILWPNSPAPLTDDWKVTDDSSVNFHDVFFFIFCQIVAKNEEKPCPEIYGWVIRKVNMDL